ncbi:OmpA family protein [Bowmanella yangjiangensis]|uniref:OmpA family protein n=1 Tax=Bowmanella yangjiangensis TaxID=2811230 RepID=A0ABS3CND5_9ALTE|nr:OmpA family protein [Bowmanella yangjiangensis]MBN7818616.1 OmpA family protein [Bowmanella yangjiangensis]
MTNFHVQRQALKELLVGFPSGSAKIPVTELDKLFQQAELIKQNPRSLAMIYGYRDPGLGDALPESLALSRAEAVKRELISFGIRPSLLHIVEDQNLLVPHPSLQGAAMTVLIQQCSVS